MSKVAVITDSTAYIPDSLLLENNITVVPQVLIWGDETFRDGVDIMPDDFYKRLGTCQSHAYHLSSCHSRHENRI